MAWLRRWGRAIGVVLGLGVGWGVAGPGASVGFGVDEPLRWKLQAGETLRYESVQTTVVRISDPSGPEVNTTQTLTMDLTWRVQTVDPQGVATVAQTIDRIRNTATTPLGKLSFDSQEAGTTGPAAGMAKALVGAEITFKLGPRGDFSEIQVPEKLVGALRGGTDAAGPPGDAPAAMLRNMLIQSGVPLPEAIANPGQTWTRKLPVPAGPNNQTREVEQTYTARGPEPEGNKALVGIDMATTFSPAPADPEVPVTIRQQEATGHFAFDPMRGRIASSRVVEKVDLTATIEGREVGQISETTTKITLQP